MDIIGVDKVQNVPLRLLEQGIGCYTPKGTIFAFSFLKVYVLHYYNIVIKILLHCYVI